MADGMNIVPSARPTIRLDGQELPLLSANITRFRLREAQGGLSSCELTLADVLSFAGGGAGYGATPGSPIRLGAQLAIFAGRTEAPQEIFAGQVTALEAEAGTQTAPLFTLIAEDRLFAARRKRRSRLFEQMSPAEVLRAVAGDHGLTPEIRGLDAPVTDWVQMNESDLGFLRRILAPLDADLLVVGERLQAGPVADAPRATVALTLGRTLLRARLTADLAEQVTALRLGSHDPASGEAVSAEASSGRMGPGAGRDGAALLRDVAGEVREHLGHHGPMTQQEAQTLAEAEYGRRARRFVRVDATASGDPAIRVGTQVTISGVNPFFENDYTVVEATHRFDQATGYLTDFMAEGAYLGVPA
ncbi:phage late control D family protein [Falsiroseomonas sp.]|uniref:phage late control D family protein n=1 Tax=Falsiroseomonas sp. TaxID=2870721 RepID=UPI003565DF7E